MRPRSSRSEPARRESTLCATDIFVQNLFNHGEVTLRHDYTIRFCLLCISDTVCWMQMEILHKLFYMFSFKIHKKHCKLVVLLVGFSFLICARCLICVNDNSILRKTSSLKTGLNWTGIIIITSASACVCVCTPLPSFLMHTELSCSVYTLSAHWITDAVNALPCYRFTLFFCTRLNKYSLNKYGYCNIYLTYDVQAVLFPIHHMKLQNTVYDGRCKSPYNKKNQIKRHVHDNH